MTKTENNGFREAIEYAIHLMSTTVSTTMGEYCSAAKLVPVSETNLTNTLYINALQQVLSKEGTLEEGSEYVQNLLSDYRVERKEELNGAYTLVPSDGNVSVTNQLYISSMQRLLNSDG